MRFAGPVLAAAGLLVAGGPVAAAPGPPDRPAAPATPVRVERVGTLPDPPPRTPWAGPWSVNRLAPVTPDARRVEAPAPARPAGPTSVPAIFLRGAVRFYQVGISPADGASCRLYPTCSGYAMDALRSHGPVVGFVMTSERVMRNHAGEHYPPVEKHGVRRLHDPVSANDFWFPGTRRRLLEEIEARERRALERRRAAGLGADGEERP